MSWDLYPRPARRPSPASRAARVVHGFIVDVWWGIVAGVRFIFALVGLPL